MKTVQQQRISAFKKNRDTFLFLMTEKGDRLLLSDTETKKRGKGKKFQVLLLEF